MHAYTCPLCGQIAYLESLSCPFCGGEIGIHPPSQTMLAASSAGVDFDGAQWVPCSNRDFRCNWLVDREAEDSRCPSCRITRRRPAADDTIAREKVADVDVDKRRLLLRLADLGLPVVPWYEQDGGLGFDLLSSRSGDGPVTIGHANGIITIDVAETLDDHRERLRVRLGEPYRTMLGHLRHEVGHYYQWVLLEAPAADDDAGAQARLDECRALFGDERASYADAIARHYRTGAPRGWARRYISEYATMHPWEDFAETWAHYLHLTDTLTTLASAGVDLDHEKFPGILRRDIVPRLDYRAVPTDELLEDWYWCSKLLNRANRAMGKGDLYPFTITPAVAEKIDFVHRLVQSVAAGSGAAAEVR